MLTHTQTVRTFLSHREARGRLCRLMTGLGYKVIGTDNDILFERGNAVGKIPGSPPRVWPIRVFAHLTPAANGVQVLLRWEIQSAPRVISVWDASSIKAEIQAAIKTINAREVNLRALEELQTSNAVITLGVHLVLFLTLTVSTVLMLTHDISPLFWGSAIAIAIVVLATIRAPLSPPAPKGRKATQVS